MTDTIATLDATVTWRICESHGGHRWTGWCDDLGLSMEAASPEEMASVVREAADLLLRDLAEDGELDAWLAARGWTMTRSPGPPDPIHRYVVPFEMTHVGPDELFVAAA